MPEGHSVKRLALAFDELFAGEPLRVTSPQGRFSAGAALLDGLTLVTAEAHGKHLFLGFAGAEGGSLRWLRVHLGLYGSWVFQGDEQFQGAHAIGAPRRRVGERDTVLDAPVGSLANPSVGPLGTGFVPAAPVGEVRARLVGKHGCADLSGPTACEVIGEEEKAAVHAKLGPDPLRADHVANPSSGREEFVRRVRRRKTPVGTLLMDQAVIAGVGNIYRAEALFRAGLDPLAPGASLAPEVLAGLWDDLVVLMAEGVETGVIVTTRPEHRGGTHAGSPVGVPGRRPRVRQNERTPNAGERVPHDEAFYVYQRAGEPCRVCSHTIVLSALQSRKLYHCPHCQSNPPGDTPGHK
ncbi:Fpg/Nei family DNA glycosylase [Micrococcales bacterium 31B]|nr:Fpg/Nei family DNA glycosylase [Micrococcales bacterium 31B]